MKLIDLLNWLNKLDLELYFKTKKLNKHIKSQKDIILFIQDILNVSNNNQLTEVFPENYDALSGYINDKRKVSLKKVIDWSQLLQFKFIIKKKTS